MGWHVTAREKNLGLRCLGIVLPVAVPCLYAWGRVPHFAPAGCVAISMCIWLVLTAVLAIRRGNVTTRGCPEDF